MPWERRRLRSFVEELAHTQEPQELRLRMRDGARAPFDALLHAAAGAEEIRWAITQVDELRQAEERLRELRRQREELAAAHARELATVLHELPFGVAIVDAVTCRIRTLNRRAEEIVGDLEGQPIGALERYRLDGTPLALDEWAAVRALRGEVVARETILVRTASRGETVVDVGASCLHAANGEATSVVVTFDDVTDRERRERADRDFVSNAAHQLRTPLAAIASAVAVLQSGAHEDPEARRRFLDHVARETDRLTRLAGALLTLARVERGEQRARMGLVELAPILEELAVHVRQEGRDVAVEVAPDTAAVANEELLAEALSNLVSNALRHAGEDATVRLGARIVDDWVEIDVSDDGPGIPIDVMRRVFDRFYRVPGASREGFGLGLPIARAAVVAAGGTLDLSSEPGRGTTASVRLRAAHLRQ